MKISVFKVSDDGSVGTVSHMARGFRLCPKIGTNISDRKMRMTVGFLKNAIALSKSNNSEKIVAVATQAAREAPNFTDLQKMILNELGINLRTISGEQEARLSAISARKITKLDEFVSFDLGCGSVEVVEFKKKVKGAWSLPVSSLTLSQTCNLKSAEAVVANAFDALKFHDNSIAKYPLLGSGGILRVAALMINGKTRNTVSLDELQSLFDTIKDKTKDEMVALGVPKVRADIFAYGLLIMLKLTEKVGSKEVAIVHGNLRLSLAFDFFGMLK
jgi:exopolyphosphatase/guanosine-5'-triphosphate,3'-diphosphate pyrophosphatase